MNRNSIIFLNVLIIATCGLIYELLAGTLASYVLGDSVTQFSLIIGIYLFAMGVGAWLSGFIDKGLARRFVDIEIAVALLGGFSAPLLFLSFARLSFFQVVLYLVVFGVGALVGLEIPLLMRILKDTLDFKDLVSRVLTFDYIGALVASLLFPLFLVPKLGIVRTSLLFGMLNAAVGLWATWLLEPQINGTLKEPLREGEPAAPPVAGEGESLGGETTPRRAAAGQATNWLRVKAVLVMVLLLIGFIKANTLTQLAEDELFADDIIYTKTTHYQRIVVTRGRAGFQLFLNGHLQFSSADEYRYHEALVHPAMMSAQMGTQMGATGPRRVLILGGGDGLALREVLKYPGVEAATLVDLDPDMTNLSKAFSPLAELNRHSYDDPRVTVINRDAMIWLDESQAAFDAVIIDFPDPNTFALGKLYTTRFYKLLKARLAPDAAISIQCTSPLFARNSYWCVVRTLEAAGFAVHPYQTAVPSFGVWGFALAKAEAFEPPQSAPKNFDLRFLDDNAMRGLFVLSADISPVPVEINRLDNQALVRYYEAEWKRYE